VDAHDGGPQVLLPVQLFDSQSPSPQQGPPIPDIMVTGAHWLFVQTFEQHSPGPGPPVSQKVPKPHLLPIIEQDGGPHMFMGDIQFRDSQSAAPQHAPPVPEGSQVPEGHTPEQHSSGLVHEAPIWQSCEHPAS
jgi:hypothetical protein